MQSVDRLSRRFSMHTVMYRRVLVSISTLAVFAWSVTCAFAANEPAVDPAQLAKVLGSEGAAGWKITPPTYVLSSEPALVAPAAPGVTLESLAVHAAPSEYFY